MTNYIPDVVKMLGVETDKLLYEKCWYFKTRQDIEKRLPQIEKEIETLHQNYDKNF